MQTAIGRQHGGALVGFDLFKGSCFCWWRCAFYKIPREEQFISSKQGTGVDGAVSCRRGRCGEERIPNASPENDLIWLYSSNFPAT